MSKQYDWLPQWDFRQDLNGITENAVFPEYLAGGKYQPRTLIDETLEAIDPTPNIHTMFVQFNEKFFWNQLLPVQVRWSQRMTSCAGTCSFHPRNRECIIALSAPLLKLRPRKDLVETLLHEMIHGYLFLTNNNRDRDGHGPEFCKHMNRINRDAGTNITIYHSFHDEVRLYQQHWWRCNGPCQSRAPYFGTVRRVMNRAPGPSDHWFKAHQINCGGEFIKIREPESKKKVKSNNKEVIKAPEQSNTMDRYVTSNNSKNTPPKIMKPPSNVPKICNGVNKINGLGTCGCGKSSISSCNNCPCKCNSKNSAGEFTKLGSGTNNVYGFGTGGPGSSQSKPRSNNGASKSESPGRISFTGVVGGNATGRSNLLDKFHLSSAKQISKRPELLDNNSVQCPVCNINFSHDLINGHIDICLAKGNDAKRPPAKRPKISNSNDNDRSNASNFSDNGDLRMCPICHKKFPDDMINIHVDECLLKQTAANSTSSTSNERTDQNLARNTNDLNVAATLRECPVCSEFFTEDTIFDHVNTCLIDGESQNTNNQQRSAVINLSTSPMNDKTVNDIITCPTCSQNIREADYIVHVEICLVTEYINAKSDKNSIVILDDDIQIPGSSKQNEDSSDKYKCLVCDAMISKSIPLNEHLDYCVSVTYRDTTIAETSVVNILPSINIDDEDDTEEEEEKHLCPICMKMIEERLMAQHVDDCITSIH